MSFDSDAPFPFYPDLAGAPLQGGSVYFGTAGQNPITAPMTVYWDEAGTQPAAQPIAVVNGMTTRNGTPSRLWIPGASYSRLVLDSKGRQVVFEPTPPSSLRAQLAASGGSALVYTIQSGAAAVPRPVSSKLNEWVSLEDYGGAADGVTLNDAAMAAAKAVSHRIKLGEGTYLFGTVDFVHNSALQDGFTLEGASTAKTILKSSGGSTTLLNLQGNGVNTVNHTFRNFSLDMSLMANAATTYGIYTKGTWGNTFDHVNVINAPAASKTLRADTGTFTTVFDNCDLGSTTGIVHLQGANLSNAVTTLTFIGCSSAQMYVREAVAISVIAPVIQGALNKFDVDDVDGFTITGGDIEGTGTLFVFGANVNHFFARGCELAGFTGTFSTGTILTGAIEICFGGQPYQWAPVAGATLIGVLKETSAAAALVRKEINSTNAVAQVVDQHLTNIAGGTFFGLDAAGNTYIDQRGTGIVNFQTAGITFVAADASATYTLRPGVDNTTNLGTAAKRWATVYAATGAINTSDGRQKQQVRSVSDAERAAAVRCKGLIRAFKFNDSVDKKGGGARIHFGVVAQDVRDAFAAEGLDASKYGLFCYDEWQDMPELIQTWQEQPEIRDGLGRIVQEHRAAGQRVIREHVAAGNRYGVRYEELLAFVISAL